MELPARPEGWSTRVRYQACEAVVAAGRQSFVDVGLALAEISRDRLYKEEYDSFEVYCREKWHYGRRHVYQLISAAELFTHLCAICAHCKPDHGSQLRPLVGLTPEQAQLAWTCAVENVGGRKITARLVKKAMQDLGLAAPPKPALKTNRNEKAERRKLINDTIGQLLLRGIVPSRFIRMCSERMPKPSSGSGQRVWLGIEAFLVQS